MKYYVDVSATTIEQILEEWLTENPGKLAEDMPAEEFSDRLLERLTASVRAIPDS